MIEQPSPRGPTNGGDALLLSVKNLSVQYEVGAGTFPALQNVSFELRAGRVLGIVGETGCGKSTLGHAIPRLLPEPPARITSGKIVFRGTDLLTLPKWKMPTVRGTGIGMIFQEPLNSLHPAYRVYTQVAESIRIRRLREGQPASPAARDVEPHDYSQPPGSPGSAEMLTRPFLPGPLSTARRPAGLSATEVREEVTDFLRLVRINDPERILDRFPHELSGGIRQRVMIAMTLSQKPSLLIADEPTSALDVTIQAQVLTLMKELMQEVQTSILFISHDLGVIAEMADDVGVMYAGHLVEIGPVREIFSQPQHPYTKSLLRSIPNRFKEQGLLPAIPGSVPNLSRLPRGCPFHPRCPIARPNCAEPPGPTLVPVSGRQGHSSECYYPADVEGMA